MKIVTDRSLYPVPLVAPFDRRPTCQALRPLFLSKIFLIFFRYHFLTLSNYILWKELCQVWGSGEIAKSKCVYVLLLSSIHSFSSGGNTREIATAVILNEKILIEDGQENIPIRIFFKYEAFFEEKINIFLCLGDYLTVYWEYISEISPISLLSVNLALLPSP